MNRQSSISELNRLVRLAMQMGLKRLVDYGPYKNLKGFTQQIMSYLNPQSEFEEDLPGRRAPV